MPWSVQNSRICLESMMFDGCLLENFAETRGNSFGYQDLIVDIRNIPIMQSFGKPVVLDLTHSMQKPNQENGISGGTPLFIETMGCAGIAANVDGIFLETHPNPKEALSDGHTMLELKNLKTLLTKLVAIKKVIS